MKSIIYKKTKEELQYILDNSNSIREAMEKSGLRDVGSNRKTLYKAVKTLSLSMKKLEENRQKAFKDGKFCFNKINNDEIFIENSDVSRSVAKNRILKQELLEYKCSRCSNKGEWLKEELVLNLEHKNGIPNDNRIENLEFLCPNCHAQTETFSGKNYKESNYWIEKIKKPEGLTTEEGRKMLIEMNRKRRRLNNKQVKLVLENKDKLPKTKLGKMFGVSDKTIAKLIKNNGYIEK